MEITSNKQSRPESGDIQTRSGPDDGPIHEGHVYTEHGIVLVYTQWDVDKGDRFATLRMVLRGQHYHTWVEGYARPRRLVTLAARFADECARLAADPAEADASGLLRACETARQALSDRFEGPNAPYTPWALDTLRVLDTAIEATTWGGQA